MSLLGLCSKCKLRPRPSGGRWWCNKCVREDKKIRVRAIIIAAKGDTCMDCNKKWPYYVLDFDHVPERGEKLFAISSFNSASGITKLLTEIAKCDVICSNCHREREHKRSGEECL